MSFILYALPVMLIHSDVNECAPPESHNCDINAMCLNTIGTFTCMCNRGYSGVGTSGTCVGKTLLLTTLLLITVLLIV